MAPSVLVTPWPNPNPDAFFDTPAPPGSATEIGTAGLRGKFVSGPVLDASDFGPNTLATLQTCRDACIAQRKVMYVPAGDWPIGSTFDINANGFRLLGDGPSTRFVTSGDYDGIVIGPNAGGPPIGPSGWASSFQVFRNTLRPNNGHSGLTIRRQPEFIVDAVTVHQGFDVAFDFIDNCYMAAMYNCRATFGGNNVGLLLRTGPQSGSDLSFYSNNFGGFKAAVWMDRDGGGYRFFGGQWSAGDSDTVDRTDLGILTVGRGYFDGLVGGVPAITMVGVSFEGGWRRWHIYAQEKIWLEMIQQNFNAVQAGANAMLGIVRCANAQNSRLAFRSGSYHGNPPKTSEKSITGANAGFRLLEENWRDLPSGGDAMT